MTRRIQPRWGRWATAAPRLFASFAAASVMIAGSACSTDDEPQGLLGIYVGFDEEERLVDFEEDLGAPVDLVVTMADSSSPDAMVSSVWGQFVAPEAYLPTLSDRVQVVVSVPVAFGPGGMARTAEGRDEIGQNLRAVADGRDDADFRLVARYLVEAGHEDAIIRLGHEFDSDWAPYSSRDNEEAYIAAFRHIHGVLTSVSPAFQFDWTSTAAHFLEYGPAAYPGDDVVDMIGLDLYWRSEETITDQVWERRFERVLQSHLEFATDRGKPVSYPEWGRALVDEPRFIELMHGWFSELPGAGPGGLVYQAYFNEPGLFDDEFYPYDLEQLPVVKNRYIGLFG